MILAVAALSQGCSAKVRSYKAHVVETLPHDRSSYTQGLFFHGGSLYESTGQWGESTMRIVDLRSGEALRKLDFDRKYFVEGSVILDGNLYILTWTGKVAFIYDAATLEWRRSVAYPREGWGLTTDGKQLIASDGSSKLYFMDTALKTQRTVQVRLDGRPVKYLNELEWIDGKIWANVYMSDMILIINPSDGSVEATVDCTGLLPRQLRNGSEDVLNGIAYDPSSRAIYLTGKYWPKMFRIELK